MWYKVAYNRSYFVRGERLFEEKHERILELQRPGDTIVAINTETGGYFFAENLGEAIRLGKLTPPPKKLYFRPITPKEERIKKEGGLEQKLPA